MTPAPTTTEIVAPTTTEIVAPPTTEIVAPTTTEIVAPTTTEIVAPKGSIGEDEAPYPGEVLKIVNADPVLVDIAGFKIATATTVYKTGIVNFEVTNLGDVPHEFGIARGQSYGDLPQLEKGFIDEEALGKDFLGKTPAVFGVLGSTRQISFDLAPGSYVFFCNLGRAVSHAARGQVLSSTVVD